MASRRRADASDASFSFQIPTTAWGDDFLLEDDSDFLKGAEDILATPAPASRFALEPLTINDLTPRPPGVASSSLKSSPKQLRSRSLATEPQGSPARRGSRKIQQARPKPNSLRRLQDDTTALQSPAGDRIESLRAQVNFLTEELNDVQEPAQSDSPKLPVVPKRHSLHRREAAVQRKDPAKNTRVLNDGHTRRRQRRGTRLSSIAPIAATAPNECHPESQKVLSPKQVTGVVELDPPVGTINPDSSVGTSAEDGMAGRSLMFGPEVLTDTHLPFRSPSPSPRIFESDDACQPAIVNENFVEGPPKVFVADVGPLTVSQLSPQKCTSRGSEHGDDDEDAPHEERPAATLRSSSKRPASVEASDENEGTRPRKKGRPDPASTANANSPTPSLSKHANTPLLVKRRPSGSRKSIRRLSSGSRAKESLVGRTSTSRGKAPLVVRPGSHKSGSVGSVKDKERESGCRNSSDRNKNGIPSNQSQNSSEPHRAEWNRNRDRPHKMQSAGSSTNATASTSQHHPPTTEHARTARSDSNSTSGIGAKSSSSKVNILHSTIPVGFRFSVDARLEARKVGGASANPSESKKTNGEKDRTNSVRNDLREQRRRNLQNQIVQLKKARASTAAGASGSGSSGMTSSTSSIPDFKAIHATQEAELARQRDRLSRTRPLPVVPMTPHFVTDHRLKERHKFEEKIKMKEKRLKEEREVIRREKEMQEEMQVRELRKKAVPKAHDVPEWYKDAPKKAKLGESG